VPASGLPGSTAEAARLETLSHVFLSCPVAMRAWWWLRGVWARLVPRAATHASEQEAAGRGRARLGSRWGAAWALAPPAVVYAGILWVVRCSHGHTTAHSAVPWSGPSRQGRLGAEEIWTEATTSTFAKLSL